jgi:hypothetical protein
MLPEDNIDLIASLRAKMPQASSEEILAPIEMVPSEPVPAIVNNSDKTIINSVEVAEKGNTIMADIVTGTVTGQLDISSVLQGHSDIRREIAAADADIRRDVAAEGGASRATTLKESCEVNANVKQSAWNVSDRVGTEADRIVGQSTAYFIAQQQNDYASATALAALKANADLTSQRLTLEIAAAGDKAASASALESAKVAAAVALGQAQLERALVADGMTTRALMTSMKFEDQNRFLIERNQELVDCKSHYRHAEYNASQSQFAILQNQLQAFQSQLQETRQGMVNFGTMSGSAGQQTSTANNVR